MHIGNFSLVSIAMTVLWNWPFIQTAFSLIYVSSWPVAVEKFHELASRIYSRQLPSARIFCLVRIRASRLGLTLVSDWTTRSGDRTPVSFLEIHHSVCTRSISFGLSPVLRNIGYREFTAGRNHCPISSSARNDAANAIWPVSRSAVAPELSNYAARMLSASVRSMGWIYAQHLLWTKNGEY